MENTKKSFLSRNPTTFWCEQASVADRPRPTQTSLTKHKLQRLGRGQVSFELQLPLLFIQPGCLKSEAERGPKE